MLFKICVLIYGYFAGALIQAGYWMGKFNKIDIGIMAVAMQELPML